MEPEKASTRMKTKKTKMLMSFKNTFCDKNWQTQKFVLNFKFSKFEFEIWIWNVTSIKTRETGHLLYLIGKIFSWSSYSSFLAKCAPLKIYHKHTWRNPYTAITLNSFGWSLERRSIKLGRQILCCLNTSLYNRAMSFMILRQSCPFLTLYKWWHTSIK